MKNLSLLTTTILGAGLLLIFPSLTHASDTSTASLTQPSADLTKGERIAPSRNFQLGRSLSHDDVSARIMEPIFTTAALAASTTDTMTPSDTPIVEAVTTDPRLAAQGFVAHVNYARVALAMNNGELARKHIAQARKLGDVVTSAVTEKRRVLQVMAGRISYSFDTDHQYNYFPIETGPVELKEMSNGPPWASNSLAVSDAEIVYLTLDLTHDKAESYLAAAESDIAAGNLKDAKIKLGQLTDAVVTVDSKTSAPLDKARDNIVIAQNFIKAKNYDGARFALSHADDALEAMSKDDNYKARRSSIAIMHQEIGEMRDIITKKDPTLLEKVGSNLDKWMVELKAWANK